MLNYHELGADQVEFVHVADSDDIPDGDRLLIEIDNLPVVIFRIAGKLFAIGDVCSHDNGPLGDGDLDDHEIICPRHGARFDVRSGQVRSLPAFVDIPAYPVRESDGRIELGLPL